MLRKTLALGAAAALLVTGSASASGIFDSQYLQVLSIDGSPANLEQTSMNLTFDGTYYWSSSGGSPGGNRLAQFDGAGNWMQSYQPGIDFRSVFTVGGSGSTVYGRGFASNQILVQTSPGVFANHVTLVGGSLDAQSQVEFNSDGTEFIAHQGGVVNRWDLSGNHLGTVSLSGYGSMFGEGVYPQDRGIVAAMGYYLTYSNSMLSAWDDSGNRVGYTELVGAGTSFDSHFSLSWANDHIWVIDQANGTWRGYFIPELVPAPGAIALFGLVGLLGRRRRR